MNTCKKCGVESNNFTPKDRSGYCRSCKKEYNAKRNPMRNMFMQKKYGLSINKAVYAILEDDKVVYVGESNRAAFRIEEHLKGHKGRSALSGLPKGRLSKMTVEILWEGDNDLKRKIMETSYIHKFNPVFNTRYKMKI